MVGPSLKHMRRSQSLRALLLPVLTFLGGVGITLAVLTRAGAGDAVAQPGIQSEVRTARLTLVGPAGATRAVLGEATVAGLAGTGLVVYDRDGTTPRLAEGVTTGGQAGLAVLDSAGRVRLLLSEGFQDRDDGSVSLTGQDANGTPRFELFYDPNAPGGDVALIRVLNGAGRVRAALRTFGDGGVALLLRDEAERLRAEVGVAPTGAPEIVLLDEAGNVIWRAP